MSQRAVETANRQKTEKIISSELKKAASKPELQRRVAVISPLSGLPESSTKVKIIIQRLHYSYFSCYLITTCCYSELLGIIILW